MLVCFRPPLEKGFRPPEQVWASQNCRKNNSWRRFAEGLWLVGKHLTARLSHKWWFLAAAAALHLVLRDFKFESTTRSQCSAPHRSAKHLLWLWIGICVFITKRIHRNLTFTSKTECNAITVWVIIRNCAYFCLSTPNQKQITKTIKLTSENEIRHMVWAVMKKPLPYFSQLVLMPKLSTKIFQKGDGKYIAETKILVLRFSSLTMWNCFSRNQTPLPFLPEVMLSLGVNEWGGLGKKL